MGLGENRRDRETLSGYRDRRRGHLWLPYAGRGEVVGGISGFSDSETADCGIRTGGLQRRLCLAVLRRKSM